MKPKFNYVLQIKILTIFILFFVFFLPTFADSDFENDYTLIDCINGDDSIGVPFDSEKPYQTLKGGIEKTIDYINANINKSGNEETASGAILNIKIECTMNDIKYKYITFKYDGIKYNNELIIEGINENSFIISDIYLYGVSGIGSNIVFKNANFLNTVEGKGYYLSDFVGLKIQDSYISIKNGENLLYRFQYSSYSTYRHYYHNKQLIENSIIDIEITGDYTIGLSTLVKNSKINFKNIAENGTYDIYFFVQGTNSSVTNYRVTDYSILISNEIDLGGNNFIAANNLNLAFINNKISNFSNFEINNALFINNLIENEESLNISSAKNLYNNIFMSGFIDTYDIYNLRKNFHIDNIGPKGIAWVFKKKNSNRYLNINISSSKLYQEITGNEIPANKNAVYVIYQ